MYDYRVDKVLKVVDGDTVDVRIDMGFAVKLEQRVRLYGINAPESRTRDKEEKKRGLAAKAKLKELLRTGDIRIETKLDKKGKYGRVLGTLFVETSNDEVNINKNLVESGHAVEYFGGKR
jgi:micrococcal nuclease